ncbi:hypothetical protein [Vagococcus intermedius]|uniref:Leucine-rich repeat domain-containing protein n=1 Tax=Vagococcus intermedius TaxID=2991418 RepID=A0AAF0CU41_9ENTE|nr:hypothetical protein [Vagococcus intermedius]WEG73030.1 hypothetical protein OL234_08640 [Vagococcus intermedius]WEG75115.1 hypothetical protein OL235_08635 [Vagococcus intermedius]
MWRTKKKCKLCQNKLTLNTDVYTCTKCGQQYKIIDTKLQEINYVAMPEKAKIMSSSQRLMVITGACFLLIGTIFFAVNEFNQSPTLKKTLDNKLLNEIGDMVEDSSIIKNPITQPMKLFTKRFSELEPFYDIRDIKFLKVSYQDDGWLFSYSLNGNKESPNSYIKTSNDVVIHSSDKIKEEEFQLFPNLESLDLANSSEIEASSKDKPFHGLKNLKFYVGSLNQTVADVTTIFDNPDEILGLGLHLISKSDNEGLKEFPQLKFLDIRYISEKLEGKIDFSEINTTDIMIDSAQITDLSWLKDVKPLKKLQIKHPKGHDYTFLYKMPKLTTLNITDNHLDDIDFINNMPMLTHVSLHTKKVKNFDVLKDSDTLSSLELTLGDSVKDISFIETISNLVDLNLNISGNSEEIELPLLKKLEFLTNLTLSQPLNELDSKTVNNLVVEGQGDNNDDLIKNFPNLKKLTVTDLKINKWLANDSNPDLEELNIRASRLYDGKLESILAVNGLKKLSITDSYIENFNQHKVTKKSHVTDLEISRSHIDKIKVSDVLACMPEIKNLKLVEDKLDRIPDLSSFPNLESLDISFNTLSSISDMSLAPKLKKIIITGNDIKDSNSVDSKVIVVD